MTSAFRLGVVAAAALAVAGCSTLSNYNPFRRADRDASNEGAAAPSAQQRIPLIALDQQLKVADALAGSTIQLPPAQPRTDWPLPGGTLEQTVGHVAAGQDFQIAWRRDIGKGTSRYQFITAPPVIANGVIYTMDAGATVTAFDERTGRQLWRNNLTPKTLPDGTRPRRLIPPIFHGNTPIDTVTFGGGIAYGDGRLYVASGYRFVAAIDASSGELIWRTFTPTPIHAAPTVAQGRVFTISTDNELRSFDAATGRAGWTYQALIEPVRILKASSPAVSGDTVVAAFSSGEVTAVRAANGAELWPANLIRASRTTALGDIRDIAGRPVIYQGDVYAGSHSGVFAAIDFRTGAVRWELPIITMTTPLPVGDVVYVVSKAGEVICISRATGQVYWISDLNEGRRQTRRTRFLGREVNDRAYWTGPILASNRLVTVSSDGRAAALNPLTGEVLGYLNLGAAGLIAPVAANGMIYVVTDKGQLVAIR